MQEISAGDGTHSEPDKSNAYCHTIFLKKEKKVNDQSQHNVNCLSETVATCFGLISPSSGPYIRQIAGTV
jgi:hypothetical protein